MAPQPREDEPAAADEPCQEEAPAAALPADASQEAPIAAGDEAAEGGAPAEKRQAVACASDEASEDSTAAEEQAPTPANDESSECSAPADKQHGVAHAVGDASADCVAIDEQAMTPPEKEESPAPDEGAAAPAGQRSPEGSEPADRRVLAPTDEEALSGILRDAGVDPDRYGVAGAKSLRDLLAEIAAGESSLLRAGEALQRLVEPVFVQLRLRDKVLVEVEQRFLDGRSRRRNMVLAEKRAAADADPAATALRGVIEELELPMDADTLQTYVHVEQEACITECRESPSYPGLQCVYRAHYVSLQLQPLGESVFQSHGRLQERFETAEHDKVNVWEWMTLEAARALRVKGLPEPEGEGIAAAS